MPCCGSVSPFFGNGHTYFFPTSFLLGFAMPFCSTSSPTISTLLEAAPDKKPEQWKKPQQTMKPEKLQQPQQNTKRQVRQQLSAQFHHQ
ncbi:hypothetical protein BOX15_Mlig028175g1 [Macrostomum lignano]|uniref:Uncharacterized protein n=1 Tax=Macrostomum lignano TaxID=282301 RepID=A0A267DX68_9PLAT|nr:hypothetical protein BOX15_Mlig028175g2 [Macrostomum lignano]PAA60358.1 hypothetical protein BOX15_Mlig028175g1 [Macrostomum lignano]